MISVITTAAAIAIVTSQKIRHDERGVGGLRGVADWLAFATIAEFARLARPDPQGREGCDGASSSRLLMLVD
jgi:hypothetical protein